LVVEVLHHAAGDDEDRARAVSHRAPCVGVAGRLVDVVARPDDLPTVEKLA
jgi:hypothetical protein